ADATGKENDGRGSGNLVIGDDEREASPKDEQTGENNLVLGSLQTFTSFGSILGGVSNTVSGPYSDVFGNANLAAGQESSVTGGLRNTATAQWSSVSGGR